MTEVTSIHHPKPQMKKFQPKGYKWFIDHYPYCYDNMFKNYYKKLKEKYDYFVIFPMINEKPFYINDTLDNIIRYVDKDKNNYEYVEILNCKWNNYYQDIYEYCYFNNKKEKFLCEEFRNQYGRILYRNPTKNITWEKHFYDENLKRCVYHRCKNNILFWKDSYEIIYNSKNKQWRVHKWIAFSNGRDVEFNEVFKDYIEKMLKKMDNKKYKGFYQEDISLICDILNIN